VLRARWHELLAGFVLAVAGNLYFFAACGFAVVAAVLLVRRDRALTRLMRTLFRFLITHDVSSPRRFLPSVVGAA
jgi:hypothetical protein